MLLRICYSIANRHRQTDYLRTLKTLCVLAGLSVGNPGLTTGQDVEYSRDVRPILASKCFGCHGADDAHREADLRLDTFAGVTDARDGRAAIVPGKPDDSQLIVRVTSTDVDLQMPPPDTGKSLSPGEIATLRQWIASGAEYQQHWAFIPPSRPDVPQLNDPWIANPIDAFILQKLRRNGLSPSEQADPSVALRRLSLDLVGLPPDLQDLQDYHDQIQSEGRSTAWKQQVHRLLASPHFGEKWGRHWLDAARYADSDGYEKDKPRVVWFYRDWVIDAFNSDLPYNEFLIQQLAGDLLPDRTQHQLVATGFLRNSMINEEGGVDPEQFRMEAMFDRIDAIGKGMLGLTIQCAQCHNHKYDPFSHTDYYRMFAFLNNCDEAQATVYTGEQLQLQEDLIQQISELEQAAYTSTVDVREKLHQWMMDEHASLIPWSIVRPELDASGGQKHYLLEDGSILAQGYAPTKHITEFTADTHIASLGGFRLELLNDPNLPHGGPGRSVDGLCALTEFQVLAQPLNKDGTVDPDTKKTEVKIVSATADVNPSERQLGSVYHDKSKNRRVTGPVHFAIDGDKLTAWGLDIGGGRSNVARNAVFVPKSPMINEFGFRLTFRLVQMHGGWNSDDNQNNNLGRFRLSVTDAANPSADLLPADVRRIITSAVLDAEAQSFDQLPEQDYRRLFNAWRLTQPEFAQVNLQIEHLWQQHPYGTTQLVLQERPVKRQSYLLTRGDFLKPAQPVAPGVPTWLNASSSATGQDRLSFAKWITDRNSPTTARAIVNRIWQEYFGIGIVRTVEDLGTQGEFPTHPDLLDWLAVELMEHNWSLKHIHQLIVTSSTYQQTSVVTPGTYELDPENRLLARGPRFRVSGEIVRDIALSASGLLNNQVGGPGVYPPAPEFLFEPPASYGPKTWPKPFGDQQYRRAIYTFRFRSVPYPVLENFDTPRGDTSCVRRNRSNTPLQALTTLNESLFMDCARSLAISAVGQIAQSGRHESQVLGNMMLRCVARLPTPAEAAILLDFYHQQCGRMANYDQDLLWKLISLDPTNPPPMDGDMSLEQLAAWVATARVILNLDETITKE